MQQGEFQKEKEGEFMIRPPTNCQVAVQRADHSSAGASAARKHKHLVAHLVAFPYLVSRYLVIYLRKICLFTPLCRL